MGGVEMDARFIRSLDEDVAREVACIDPRQYRAKLEELLYYDEREPYDASIVPLVISLEQHRAYEEAVRRICGAAMHAFIERRDAARFRGDSFQQILQSLPLEQDSISGTARFDFLEARDDLKLVEMNFLGVGTVGHSLQATAALMDVAPALRDRYHCLHPTAGLRDHLLRLGVRTAVLLTKDDDQSYYGSWLDRVIIAAGVDPVRMIIVPKREWGGFATDGRTLTFRGETIDAIYPRELTWRPSIEEGQEWCRFFLTSGARCLDPWPLVLLEDKDLRFLIRHDPGVERFIPKTWCLGEPGQPADCAELVLKRQHEHAGDGVWVAPSELPTEDRSSYVLQERIAMNRVAVRSVLGYEGIVSYDIAAHVSYDFDLRTGTLLDCRVTGYLSRYAPVGDIVNISKGGGVIPVLVEGSQPSRAENLRAEQKRSGR